MFRKLVLAFAATAALGAAALTPTTASAHWRPHFSVGLGFYGPGYVYAAPAPYYGCIKWVRTYYGWRRINVCY
jgi:hypothetical protein